MERKLAAILYADIVGYSRLMKEDEEGTHRIRQQCMQTVDALAAAHGGRVVNTAGDAVLAEFPSIVTALACALQIQQALDAGTQAAPERLRFRIGVNLGDVIVEGDNLYGHGVNIAARLEGLAEPGGICVPRKVVDEVGGKLPVRYVFLGERQVKNIDTPIPVYRVEHDPDRPGTVLDQDGPAAAVSGRPAPRQATWAVAVLLALLLVAVGYYMLQRTPTPQVPAPPATPSQATVDRPSLAVLPFDNMSADPAQEYFADGMTEDLITDLSKISGLLVIARNSTFAYKGTAPDLREVARELGVRYVLEGSVRKAGDAVRINAQLIDGETGGHLWAERYDGSYADVFALQDQVTSSIVATLSIRLMPEEERQLERRDTASTAAYDAYLKGLEALLQQRPEGYRQAMAQFESAIELDPGYARAYAALAATYWQVWKRYWHDELGFSNAHELRFRAEELVQKALEKPGSLAHQVQASMLAHQGAHDRAIAAAERAIALDPNSADGYLGLAEAMNLAGRPDDALPAIDRAMRLNPNYPSSYLYELGLARFLQGDFAKATASLERAVALNPADRWSVRLLIATLGHLGRNQEAAALMRRIEASWRGMDPLSVRSITFWYPFSRRQDTERLAAGLRLAGVPD